MSTSTIALTPAEYVYRVETAVHTGGIPQARAWLGLLREALPVEHRAACDPLQWALDGEGELLAPLGALLAHVEGL